MGAGFEGAVDGANLNKHPLATYADPLGTGFGCHGRWRCSVRH